MADAAVVSCDVPDESPGLPAALVWERLAERGWRAGRQAQCPHVDVVDRRLCLERSLARSAAYGRCVLRLGALLDEGLPGLHCRQAVSYYLAVLQSPRKALVLPGRPAKEYAALCRPTADDAPPDIAPPPEPLQPAAAGASSSAGALVPPPPPPPLPASSSADFVCPDADPFGAVPPASVRTGTLADGLRDVPPAWAPFLAQLADPALPLAVEGQRLSVDGHFVTGAMSYIRMRVACPHHVRCQKSRSVTFMRRFGMREPIAYLGAWLVAGADGRCSGRVEHVAHAPTAAEVVAYAAVRGWHSVD